MCTFLFDNESWTRHPVLSLILFKCVFKIYTNTDIGEIEVSIRGNLASPI